MLRGTNFEVACLQVFGHTPNVNICQEAMKRQFDAQSIVQYDVKAHNHTITLIYTGAPFLVATSTEFPPQFPALPIGLRVVCGGKQKIELQSQLP